MILVTERSQSAPVVLIASGAAQLRRRWRQAIQGPFAAHEVTEGSALARSLASRRPAALLLDLHLPELGGIEGVATIQRLRPTIKIIVLTSRPDRGQGIAALKAGARGYCDRDIDPRLLGKAVEIVCKGEIWIGRKLISHLLEELAALTEQQHPRSPAATRHTVASNQ